MRTRRVGPALFLGVLLGLSVPGGLGCLDDTDRPSPQLDVPSILSDIGGDPRLPVPVLDTTAIPGQTCESRIPIAGTARPGTRIFSTGGGGSAITSAAAGSGRFCLDIPLSPNQTNIIEIRAQEGENISPAAIVTVQHRYEQGCGGQGVSDAGVRLVEPTNLALYAPVDAIQPPEGAASASSIVDGNSSTVAMWRGDDWLMGWEGWVRVELERPSDITKVIVRWRDDTNSADKYYGRDYRVLFSDAREATIPALSDPSWKQMQWVIGGNGGDDEFNFSDDPLPTARHVALWLEADGENNFDERFAIAELEVWGRPSGSKLPPPPKPSVCAGKL